MSVYCNDCKLYFPETDEEFRRAAKRPSHWCSCPTGTMSVYANQYPVIFASGYTNEDDWKETHQTTDS